MTEVFNCDAMHLKYPRIFVDPNLYAGPVWYLQDMHKVPVAYIVAAVIPALMIAVLYYFDHSVSAQLAQQEKFNLRKPSAFHYDLLLVGGMVKFLGNHVKNIIP